MDRNTGALIQVIVQERTTPKAGTGPTRPLALAVLLSGSGRTLENFLRVIARGELAAQIVVVVSSVPGVRGLRIAAEVGIPHFTVRRRDVESDEAYARAIYATIAPYQPDLIVLAGFLRRLIVWPEWQGRILNIHPALLPGGPAGRGFYGERVHAAVLASGASESGATVHVVDQGYDTGPIVMQARVPVWPDDTVETLAARVFTAERILYPAAIRVYVATHPELFGDVSATMVEGAAPQEQGHPEREVAATVPADHDA
jgi:formyltetrahydrofolate-dependent phosphoribosylglycinamide formyltransferase